MTSRSFRIFSLVLVALLWLGYGLSGRWFATHVDASWGGKIRSATEENVSDAKVFVQNRLFEAIVLLSVAVGLMLMQSLLIALLPKRWQGQGVRWIAPALFGFISVNLWLAVAIHTTLFWVLFWQGRSDTERLAR